MVSFDMKTIGFINIFENLTHASVKDCFAEGDSLVFIIDTGQMGLAIGKGGANIKHASSVFKKEIKIYEFNPEPVEFVRNLLYPLKPKAVERQDNVVVIKASDTVEKGKVFGREKTNLKRIQGIVSKYFEIEVKVE
ncbi:MAG: NusA-like transcription termination signal-binding factor [Nanoarchaeota archaeon]|nr:NusA-like transcription termination signal-binding factor [Nanoarchaeota archaeon]